MHSSSIPTSIMNIQRLISLPFFCISHFHSDCAHDVAEFCSRRHRHLLSVLPYTQPALGRPRNTTAVFAAADICRVSTPVRLPSPRNRFSRYTPNLICHVLFGFVPKNLESRLGTGFGRSLHPPILRVAPGSAVLSSADIASRAAHRFYFLCRTSQIPRQIHE